MNLPALRSRLVQIAIYLTCAGAAYGDMVIVGSVGITDSADFASIEIDDTTATLSFAQPGPQEATIRYSVSLVPEVPTGTSETTRWTLTVRYQDGDPPNSETQGLLLRLKELRLSTGAESTVLTFDSNVRTEPGGSESDWMLRTVSGCRTYDPDAAYFLEATLSSNATPIAPLVRLGGMALKAETFGTDSGVCS